MSGPEDQTLQDAVARNCAAVLSLPSAGMLRHHKSRFLGETEDGMVIASAPGEGPLLESLIAGREECVVTFKSANGKTAFAARVLKIIPDWKMNEGLELEAILLSPPTRIKSIQRRANYRAPVLESSELKASVWRLAERTYLKDPPMAAQEILCTLRDLSVGGMGVRLYGKDGQPPKVSDGERLRVQIIAPGGEPLLVEGRMRAPSAAAAGDCITTGVAFKKLESDLEGRQTLARLNHLVGQLQRDELRRMRLGLAKAG